MQTELLTDRKVILKALTSADADAFYSLYTRPELLENYAASPFLPGETPLHFTLRILASCELIWTIRPTGQPDLVIGNCALHHWNKAQAEIEIGGALSPAHWGQGLMQAAFGLLLTVAQDRFGAATVVGRTTPRNHMAIRLVEKMGFVKVLETEQETVLRKTIGT